MSDPGPKQEQFSALIYLQQKAREQITPGGTAAVIATTAGYYDQILFDNAIEELSTLAIRNFMEGGEPNALEKLAIALIHRTVQNRGGM